MRFSKDGILNITGHIAAKTFFAGNETEYIQYNEDGFELKTHHLYQTVDKGPWSFVENASNTWSYALGNLDTHVDTQLPGWHIGLFIADGFFSEVFPDGGATCFALTSESDVDYSAFHFNLFHEG